MARKRKDRNSRKWPYIAGAVCLAWILAEGRFYFPKHIRPPSDIEPIEVVLKTTAYCHCRKCCSYKWFLMLPYQKTGLFSFSIKHVGKTSSGATVRPGTIAADTSRYPYGTVMHIPGYGYGRVEDTGGAVKGRHIDLYRPSHWFARRWGIQTKKVKVWLPAEDRTWSFNPSEVNSNDAARLPAEHTPETNQPPSPASPEQIPLL